MMVYPEKVERNRRMVRMREQGLTLQAIGRIEGVSHQMVSKVLERERSRNSKPHAVG